jgi:hypothetical protein
VFIQTRSRSAAEVNTPLRLLEAVLASARLDEVLREPCFCEVPLTASSRATRSPSLPTCRDVDRAPEHGHAVRVSKRDPERTLFALLTPRLFQEAPHSRLYGSLMEDYRSTPESLARDLPHREADWAQLSRQIGWLTWEDCEEVLPGACPWLGSAGGSSSQEGLQPGD